MKGKIALVTGLLILCGSVFALWMTGGEELQTEASVPAEPDEAYMEWFMEQSRGQAQALDAYQVLYIAYRAAGREPDWPEQYGGAYIEGNMLHINVVGADEAATAPYRELLTDYLAVVTFENVEWSMRQLERARDEIMEDLDRRGVSWVSLGIRDQENAVSIALESKVGTGINFVDQAWRRFMTWQVRQWYDVPVVVSFEGRPTLC